MAEEHRIQEGHHRLCANNCGFFGSPATQNLCSKCYGDIHTKQAQQASSAKIAVGTSPTLSSSAASVANIPRPLSPPEVAVAASDRPRGPSNRCSACRKRVGLTGFECRCGSTFCVSHRYPEQHGCSFDFKKAGKEAIARDNPVIKAEKLERI